MPGAGLNKSAKQKTFSLDRVWDVPGDIFRVLRQ